MRYTMILLCSLLTSCAYNLTLYPRGGGDVATGTLNSSNFTMQVMLKGESYSGDYVMGQMTGIGVSNTYGARPTFGSSTATFISNQRSAVLTSGNKALRCEFTANPSGGNGVCVDSANVTYDMTIKH